MTGTSPEDKRTKTTTAKKMAKEDITIKRIRGKGKDNSRKVQEWSTDKSPQKRKSKNKNNKSSSNNLPSSQRKEVERNSRRKKEAKKSRRAKGSTSISEISKRRRVATCSSHFLNTTDTTTL